MILTGRRWNVRGGRRDKAQPDAVYYASSASDAKTGAGIEEDAPQRSSAALTA